MYSKLKLLQPPKTTFLRTFICKFPMTTKNVKAVNNKAYVASQTHRDMSMPTQGGLQKAGKLRISVGNMRCLPLTQFSNYLHISTMKQSKNLKFEMCIHRPIDNGRGQNFLSVKIQNRKLLLALMPTIISNNCFDQLDKIWPSDKVLLIG